MVPDAKNYSAVESTRDGRGIEIRALRPEDRTALAAVVERSSTRSLYRRFFSVRRNFTEEQVDRFVNIDFKDHVALVSVVEENGMPAIVGGARYIAIAPGKAELAFFVIDEYQGQGIGTLLMRHLVGIASRSGLRELTAEVLSENRPMLKVFEKCGYPLHVERYGDVVQAELRLDL
jgi:RimJ/RimL family protein N-acetyltransferase